MNEGIIVIFFVVLSIQMAFIWYIVYKMGKDSLLKKGIMPGLRLPNILLKSEHKNSIRDVLPENNKTLICFMSPGCPTCKKINPDLIRIKETHPKLSIIKLISESSDNNSDELIRDNVIPSFIYIRNKTSNSININIFPYGLVVDSDGVVLKRGLLKSNEINKWINIIDEK